MNTCVTCWLCSSINFIMFSQRWWIYNALIFDKTNVLEISAHFTEHSLAISHAKYITVSAMFNLCHALYCTLVFLFWGNILISPRFSLLNCFTFYRAIWKCRIYLRPGCKWTWTFNIPFVFCPFDMTHWILQNASY